MTECPDQQVQNVQEAVRKQYGCEVRVPRAADIVVTPHEILYLGIGFLIGFCLVIFFRPR